VSETGRVRLDRWLWAARFYKTRAAAKRALEAGQVLCAGQRAKPSREIGPGVELVIGRGTFEHAVLVTGVAQRRGSAADAALLYQEAPDSIERRSRAAAQLRLNGIGLETPASRPDRRDRRALKRLKQYVPEDSTP
jgi:ribosome-associated heat shock protein Hsp15